MVHDVDCIIHLKLLALFLCLQRYKPAPFASLTLNTLSLTNSISLSPEVSSLSGSACSKDKYIGGKGKIRHLPVMSGTNHIIQLKTLQYFSVVCGFNPGKIHVFTPPAPFLHAYFCNSYEVKKCKREYSGNASDSLTRKVLNFCKFT